MHVLVTGGTGFIGQKLLPALGDAGHCVTVLTRRDRPDTSVRYITQLENLGEPVDAVINLAGASLAGRRWNAAYKAEIVASRVDTTQALGRHFQGSPNPPTVWLNGSAIGYYGPQGDQALSETAPAGEGFAAELCREWESAAREACPENCRLALLRLGVVLDRDGGAYAQMAPPFRLGIANWVGDGDQYLSWIHRQDVVSAILHLLQHEGVSGPVNLTAPAPVTSRQFCGAMKKVHRSWITAPMPAPVMRALVGEMADELLITGQRVLPSVLTEEGFAFAHPTIDDALNTIEASL